MVRKYLNGLGLVFAVAVSSVSVAATEPSITADVNVTGWKTVILGTTVRYSANPHVTYQGVPSTATKNTVTQMRYRNPHGQYSSWKTQNTKSINFSLPGYYKVSAKIDATASFKIKQEFYYLADSDTSDLTVFSCTWCM